MSAVALQLRCLLRNDAAIIEHLGNQLVGVDGVIDAAETGDPHRAYLLQRFGQAVRNAQRHKADLQALSLSNGQSLSRPSPAATEAHAPGRALPADLSL